MFSFSYTFCFPLCLPSVPRRLASFRLPDAQSRSRSHILGPFCGHIGATEASAEGLLRHRGRGGQAKSLFSLPGPTTFSKSDSKAGTPKVTAFVSFPSDRAPPPWLASRRSLAQILSLAEHLRLYYPTKAKPSVAVWLQSPRARSFSPLPILYSYCTGLFILEPGWVY